MQESADSVRALAYLLSKSWKKNITAWESMTASLRAKIVVIPAKAGLERAKLREERQSEKGTITLRTGTVARSRSIFQSYSFKNVLEKRRRDAELIRVGEEVWDPC